MLSVRSIQFVVTAFASDEIRSEAEELGGLYLEKPISLNDLTREPRGLSLTRLLLNPLPSI